MEEPVAPPVEEEDEPVDYKGWVRLSGGTVVRRDAVLLVEPTGEDACTLYVAAGGFLIRATVEDVLALVGEPGGKPVKPNPNKPAREG